jgi:PAS domain S-box-containing protein
MGRYVLLIALLWTAVMGVSLALNLIHEERESRDIALREARTQTDLDIAIRIWAASHGGVYVPVDSATPPNPYLADIPERDIATPSGVPLTLMNPAYMLRQVMGRMGDLYGMTARITSLDPIRPENAPDDWERRALDRLSLGGEEVSEFVTDGGIQKLRFLRPFRAEEDCMKCHPGALPGLVRGGISLTLPLEPLRAVHRWHSREVVVGHVFIWAIGIVSLILAAIRISGDMRKREAVEAALAESEERNRAMVEAMPDLIFRLSREGVFLDAQTSREDALLFPTDQFIGMDIRDVMPPAIAEETLGHLAHACETGEFRSFEYDLEMRGERRTYEARIVRAGRDEAIAIVREMTDRRRAEEDRARGHALLDAISGVQRLHISDAEPREVFESLLGSFLSLTESEYGFVGEALYSESGEPYLKIHAINDISGSEAARRHYAENVARGLEFRNPGTLFGAVLATGEPVVSNDPGSDPRAGGLPEGHPSIRSFLGIPFYSGRRLVGMAGLANREGGYEEDAVVYLAPLARTAATLIESIRGEERRRAAERETAEGHRFLQTVIDSVSDPVMVIEEDHSVILMNRSAREQTGAEDTADAHPLCHTITHHSDRPCAGDVHPCPLDEVRRTGRPLSVMHQHYGADGSLRYYEISASPFLGKGGGFRGIIEVGRDVTERVLQERALRESEEKFRSLAEQSPNMIFINAMGRILYTNERCTEVMGYQGEEFLAPGFDFMILVAPEDRELAALSFRAHGSGEEVQPHEYRLMTKDGRRVEVIIATRLIAFRGERAILGVITDITEQKRIEKDLERSLVEKEMLIKEVYHRVKNNLASVSSLLKLQSAQVEDARSRELFVETQNRVKAMSMIHERLYRSGDLKSIDLPEYMRSIAVQLYRSYEITEAKAKLRVNVEQVALGVDTMIPCGLILNELVTNALKHAFPGAETGTIAIELRERDGRRVFAVSDTGVGLPEGFEIGNTTSLGLRLVESLARQIDGTLDISGAPGGGTRFAITF